MGHKRTPDSAVGEIYVLLVAMLSSGIVHASNVIFKLENPSTKPGS